MTVARMETKKVVRRLGEDRIDRMGGQKAELRGKPRQCHRLDCLDEDREEDRRI